MNHYELLLAKADAAELAKLLFAATLTKSKIDVASDRITVKSGFDLETPNLVRLVESFMATKDFEEVVKYSAYPRKGDFAAVYSTVEADVDASKADLDNWIKISVAVNKGVKAYVILGTVNKSQTDFYTPLSKGDRYLGRLQAEPVQRLKPITKNPFLR